MSRDYVFTSESVTAGHPDKLCDQISDAIVGRLLRQDPLSRVIAECAVSTGIVFVALKQSGDGAVDIPHTAREVIADLGYRDPDFNPRNCTVMTSVSELEGGPPRRHETEMDEAELEAVTARDPVTLFGYACRHTGARMPLPIWLSHRLARRLARVHRDGELPYLGPDGKTQVAVELRRRRPRRIHSVTVVASQRQGPEGEEVGIGELRRDVEERVIAPVFAGEELTPDDGTRIDVNPEGSVLGGGPAVHSGLTGRKNGVDTYGEYARHSGAALSGKDPGRIDRVGAYAARHAARNVVAAGLADECELLLSYSIGLSRPVSVQVETFGTGTLDDGTIAARVAEAFDFRPAAIVRRFRLRHLPGDHTDGFYRKLATYGHVGRTDLDLPWEREDAVAALT